MTTTVLLGTTGNKEVTVECPSGTLVLKPGRWLTLGIHGEQFIRVAETGDFVSVEPGWAKKEEGEK